MPYYDYLCTNCGVFEVCRAMNDVGMRPCSICMSPSRQVITAPLFSEDKTRFRDYRKALGTSEVAPSSRSDLRRLEREKHIYFDNTLTPQEKTLKEYAQHVKMGGERLTPEQVNPTKVDSKTVHEVLKEKGIRLG